MSSIISPKQDDEDEDKSQRNPEIIASVLRETKYNIIDLYCREFISEIYSYSLRVQLVQTSNQLRKMVLKLPPHEKMMFLIGKPVMEKQEKEKEKGDEEDGK